MTHDSVEPAPNAAVTRDRGAFLLLFLIADAAIALDQITKWLVVQHFGDEGVSLPIIPGLLDLTYTRNAGAAFGIFGGQTLLFVAIALIVSALVVVYQRSIGGRQRWLTLGLGLLLGGAIGNLLDRIFRHTVVDFIHFYHGAYHFAIFNVADSCITCGVIIVAFHLLFAKHPQASAAQTATEKAEG